MRNLVIIILSALMLFANQASLWGKESSGLYEEARKLLHAGNYAGAIDKLNLALQSEQSDTNKAQIYVTLGKALFNLERAEESRHAFEEALKIDSELVPANLGIAAIESSSGRCDKALSAIERIKDKVSEIDEKRALYSIQVSCDRTDKYKTIQRLTDLISLEGKDVGVNEYLYLWELYSQTEQPRRAVEAIKKVLEISDTSENRERYAVTLFKNGQVEESIIEYKRLIQKNPKVADYHMLFANALTAKEDYKDAKKEVLIALSLAPKDAGLHYAKSLVELLMKEYDQCVESTKFAIDKGDDEIKAGALFFSGECLYCKGNIEEAVKRYEAVAKKYSKSKNATLANMLVSSISSYKSKEAVHIMVPFIKKSNISSLSTALKMVLTYWMKKNGLTEKEANAIEFDEREPTFADAWLLVKGKGFESITTKNNLDFIKMLIKAGLPVIMRENKTSNYLVITGYDERRRTLYLNDPKMDNRLGQIGYEEWHEQGDDDSIFIIMPVELKEGLTEQESTKELFSPLYNRSKFRAFVKMRGEKDGFQMAEKIYTIYPKLYEAKLVMADKLFFSKDYKTAIAYYNDLLLKKDISAQLKGAAYLMLATSYNKLGDMVNAERYLRKAKKIDPESEHVYEELLK